MLVTVLGANGPTGRLLTRLLVYRGHEVRALTRHPDDADLFGLGVTVIGGDATQTDDLQRALKGAEAVLSVLGTPYTREPVTLFSDGARALTALMATHGPRRLVVTSSALLSPWRDPAMSWLERTVMVPLLLSVGRTVYDDMRRMEAIVAASDLDWTVMRPLALADLDASTRWAVAEDHIPGRQTARRDLAAAIVDQLQRSDFVRRTAAVATTNEALSVPATIWREGIMPMLRQARAARA